jgi:hypothetical protein
MALMTAFDWTKTKPKSTIPAITDNVTAPLTADAQGGAAATPPGGFGSQAAFNPQIAPVALPKAMSASPVTQPDLTSKPVASPAPVVLPEPLSAVPTPQEIASGTDTNGTSNTSTDNGIVNGMTPANNDLYNADLGGILQAAGAQSLNPTALQAATSQQALDFVDNPMGGYDPIKAKQAALEGADTDWANSFNALQQKYGATSGSGLLQKNMLQNALQHNVDQQTLAANEDKTNNDIYLNSMTQANQAGNTTSNNEDNQFSNRLKNVENVLNTAEPAESRTAAAGMATINTADDIDKLVTSGNIASAAQSVQNTFTAQMQSNDFVHADQTLQANFAFTHNENAATNALKQIELDHGEEVIQMNNKSMTFSELMTAVTNGLVDPQSAAAAVKTQFGAKGIDVSALSQTADQDAILRDYNSTAYKWALQQPPNSPDVNYNSDGSVNQTQPYTNSGMAALNTWLNSKDGMDTGSAVATAGKVLDNPQVYSDGSPASVAALATINSLAKPATFTAQTNNGDTVFSGTRPAPGSVFTLNGTTYVAEKDGVQTQSSASGLWGMFKDHNQYINAIDPSTGDEVQIYANGKTSAPVSSSSAPVSSSPNLGITA